MRKFLIFLIGIFGFALIFSVSGLIAYYMFPAEESKPIETELQGAMVPIGNGGTKPAAPEQSTDAAYGGPLTIITPALDRTKTVVRKGTLDDAIPHKEPVMVETVSQEITDDDEQENDDEPQKDGENDTPKKSETPKKTETPAKTETPKPQESVNEEKPQEPEKPQTNNSEKPNLNPDVQTSDDGL